MDWLAGATRGQAFAVAVARMGVDLKPPPPPLLFRIVGKSTDGITVTLGKYPSREEAEPDHARFVKQADYRDIAICEIPAPPQSPTTA